MIYQDVLTLRKLLQIGYSHTRFCERYFYRDIGEPGHPASFGTKRTRRFESCYPDNQNGPIVQGIEQKFSKL